MEETHFVYLAECANGTFYVGYSTNVNQRIAAHNAGRGARHTRIHRPIRLVASWGFNSRLEARRAEREMKRLSPERKLAKAKLALDSDQEID